jgi:hypothetical protein
MRLAIASAELSCPAIVPDHRRPDTSDRCPVTIAKLESAISVRVTCAPDA